MKAERELPEEQIDEPNLEWQMAHEYNKRIGNTVKYLSSIVYVLGTQEFITIPMPLKGWLAELLSGCINGDKVTWDENDINVNSAIYAALSGKIELLEFIFNNHSDLCFDKRGDVNTLFCIALFFSRSIESLDYVWNRYQNFLPVHFKELTMASVILMDWLEGFQWFENKFSNIWKTRIPCDFELLSPIQFAAKLNKMCLIEYLNNTPEKQHFLHQRTSDGFTIAHLFAKTGWVEGLNFIKNNNNLSYMLHMFDNHNGIKCAHLATASGNPKALDFFNKNHKPLLQDSLQPEKLIENIECVIEKKPYVCDQTFFSQARLAAGISDVNCAFDLLPNNQG